MEYLPTSLRKLWIDKRLIENYDFKGMKFLKYLKVSNGEVKREDMLNLSQSAVLRMK